MNTSHISRISKELNLGAKQVLATAELLGQDSTVPFIARIGKRLLGRSMRLLLRGFETVGAIGGIDKRREAILESLIERELLTNELRSKIEAAETMAELEDIYLPFRPKRRARATIAREKGLEPLACLLLEQDSAMDPVGEASLYVDESKGLLRRRRRWLGRGILSLRLSMKMLRRGHGFGRSLALKGL